MSSSEDFKDVTKLIPQRNQNLISEKQKELEDVISNKNKVNSHLKYHIQKPLAQVKKCKTKKHKLEREKERFDKKFNESYERKKRKIYA